jgi:DNA repair exonuclease SbcCD nuclease subunit
LQLLSDLHLETESFDPEPAPEADMLVLAGDIDSSWATLQRFVDWPVPVVMVAGNHEFDGRELDSAWPALRQRCLELGITLLERDSLTVASPDGRRVRLLGTTRWCDFDLFGEQRRDAVLRAATYFVRIMRATRHGQPFDAAAAREEALVCRDWLRQELDRPRKEWDATVVITHFAPSLRSADPRYGSQPSTASFCNADDDLLPLADLWIHGHLHCRHDYEHVHPAGTTRVVCNARGYGTRGEHIGHDGLRVIAV